MKGPVLGWDVGGANVKAALLANVDAAPRILERPFALWREPGRLPEVLAEVARELGDARWMGVTMTAELADCYRSKREGVFAVLDAFGAAFPGSRVRVFGVDGRFRSAASARRRPLRVAAANWMASALLVAESHRDALFLDVGSTTTDIIPIVGGRPVPRGRTDPARLLSGELVYSGALRTPVCAIARWLPLRGRRCRVAAELFAIAADAHLWLRHIDASAYDCETPDGRGTSHAEAGARLARMVCSDDEALSPAEITAIAEHVAQAQEQQIVSGLEQVRRRLGPASPTLAVLAGQGAFLAEAAARRSGLATCRLEERLGTSAARAVPAAAVAWQLLRQGEPGGEA